MLQSVHDLVTGFEEFVREAIPRLAAQEGSWLDKVVGAPSNKVVIYGFGSLGKFLLQRLPSSIRVVAIADQQLSSRQEEIEGIPCLSPELACSQYGKDAIFIVAIFNQTGGKAFKKIKATLEDLGAERVAYFLPFFWKNSDAYLPYYALDLASNLAGKEADVLRVFDLFADEQSKVDYASFAYNVFCPEPTITTPVATDETYFPCDILNLSAQEVFIDVGAFDGDTLAKFVQKTGGQFAEYVGVEPDPENLAALKSRVEELRGKVTGKLRTEASAIGSEHAELRFKAGGTLGSALDPSGDITVPVRPLAELLDGTIPGYIKLDIEGAELDALIGAKGLLSKVRPKLAACVYHRPTHFWQIPALMRELNPEYKLYFRRHREYLDDVVAYAVS